MFRPTARSKNTRPSKGRRPFRVTTLSGESLEERLTLDGTVAVMLVGTTLTLTGDVDANDVLITKGPNPNEIVIEGKDRAGAVTTFINGPSLIDDPVDQINVYLQGGSDDFRIEGNSPNDRFVVPGPLYIENQDGNNVNRLEDVLLASTLEVRKVFGNSESTLEVVGTDVVGTAIINNNFGGAQGPTKTLVISGSTFQDDVTIQNGGGKDILVVDSSNFDGNLDVHNGNGDTRTVFGMSEDPIVFGDLSVVNGNGNDTFVLHDTTVWGKVDIDNNDGHSDTTVSDAKVGIGLPAAASNIVFGLMAGAGTDTFLMTNTEINDSLDLDYAANNADTFGSSTQISDSTIRGYVYVESDDGYDVVNVDPTVVGRDFELKLYDGSSDVTLADLSVGLTFTITANAGSDHIVIERTTVAGDAMIDLGNGVDRLEILDGSKLLGQTYLISGNGVDTFVRQVGPSPQAVDIVFLLTEDFELDQFVL
jgi:hypothetical protein